MDAGGIQSRGVTEPKREAGVKPLPDKPQFEKNAKIPFENTKNLSFSSLQIIQFVLK